MKETKVFLVLTEAEADIVDFVLTKFIEEKRSSAFAAKDSVRIAQTVHTATMNAPTEISELSEYQEAISGVCSPHL